MSSGKQSADATDQSKKNTSSVAQHGENSSTRVIITSEKDTDPSAHSALMHVSSYYNEENNNLAPVKERLSYDEREFDHEKSDSFSCGRWDFTVEMKGTELAVESEFDRVVAALKDPLPEVGE